MSDFVRFVIHCLCSSFVIAEVSFSDITRTLKPPYLPNEYNPYYVPDVTTEVFIPEIIVNRNLRDDFSSVSNIRQSDGFIPYLNNSYLPPSNFIPTNRPPLMDIPETTQTTRPPISFDPIDTPAYIPPTVSQIPNDIANDFPPKTTVNPEGYKYLPPTQQTPIVQQDPDLSDNFIPMVTPPSQAYLPSQSKGRELRDELVSRDQPNSQLQLELNELRCLPNIGGYFRAILSVQSFIQSLPIIENDIQDIRCDLQVIRTRVLINIAAADFRRCGVENCGSQQLCLKIRFPQIQGLRTLADAVLTLQCRMQERVVSKTHALRIGLNREK